MAISIKITSLFLCALAVASEANAQATDSALNKLTPIGKQTGLGTINTDDPDVGIYEKIAAVINFSSNRHNIWSLLSSRRI